VALGDAVMTPRVAATRASITAVTGMRVVAILIVAALGAGPLALLPSPALVWFTVPGVVAGAGAVIMLSVPLATVSASLSMIEYALALAVADAPVDLVTATGVGVAVFLLLELVHLCGCMHGAAVGRAVVATQVRHWLTIGAIAATAALALSVGATSLRLALAGTWVPFAVITSAVGALLAAGGVLARVSAGERRSLAERRDP
jgi:hypothetical protein